MITGEAGRRWRWHGAANAVVGAWLIAAVLAASAHPLVEYSRWLLVHLLLLGAVTSAILIWSTHFAAAVLRRPDEGRGRPAMLRLLGMNLAVLGVVVGMLTGIWVVVLAGGCAVATVALLHARALIRMLRRALPARFALTVRYFVAGAGWLPVGAGLGVVLARGDLDDDLEARLRLAHEAANVLGWVGLTMAGTLVTLWPTMLRTQIAVGAEKAGRQALWLMLAGVALIVTAAVSAPPYAAGGGLLVYGAGLLVAGRPWWVEARRRPPASAASWSVLAGCCWAVAALSALLVILLTGSHWSVVADRTAVLTAPLAVGWVAQTLLGALSYLVPVVIGGGPRTARATNAVLDLGWPTRVSCLNGALAVAVLPVPRAVRIACAVVVLLSVATFLVLLAATVWTARNLRRSPPAEPARPAGPAGPAARDPRRGLRRAEGVAAGLGLVVAAIALGVAVDQSRWSGSTTGTSSTPIASTGHTTTVRVRAQGMRFHPNRIEVPIGDRLVIVVANTDDDRHDLVLANGARTSRIPPGQNGTLEIAVVGGDLEGWCSIPGHRQMGMTFKVWATGAAANERAGTTMGEGEGSDARLDPMAVPSPGFIARDARLEPLEADTGPQVRRRTITVREVLHEVAPGGRQLQWTFDGTVPGPILHGRIGDTFEITLVNAATIGHSIDFHAGSLAPGPVMRTIGPGQSLVYRFSAGRSGIWMYHCSTMPMSLHLANGMFGAVVIDPPDRAPAGIEYVLLQSENYLGPQGESADATKLRAESADTVVFNGYANQYVRDQLPAVVGQRIRVWVLAAGPNRGTSFHVVGAQFDTVFAEGAYLLRPGDPGSGGAQTLELGPAAGGFVELTFPQSGTYPFLSHRMVDAERGARGAFDVTAGRAGRSRTRVEDHG